MDRYNNITSVLKNTGFFLSMKDIENTLKYSILNYNKESIIINIINKDIILKMFYDKDYSDIFDTFIDKWRRSFNIEWNILNIITQSNRVFILSPGNKYFLDNFSYNPSIIRTYYTDDYKNFITISSKTMKTDAISNGLLLNKEVFTNYLVRVQEYKENFKIDDIDTVAKNDSYFIFFLYYAVLAFLEHNGKVHKRVVFEKYIKFEDNEELQDKFGEGKIIISSSDFVELSFPNHRYQDNVKEFNTKEKAI